MVFGACSDDFEPASRVTRLRLLAVQADSPFALPGQDVELRALAHDPEQRKLSWGFGLCFEDASSLAIDCLRRMAFDSLRIGDTPSHTLHVPDNRASYVGVVVVVCPGTIAPGNTFGISVACLDEQGRPLAPPEFEVALKRVYVREPAQNHNPTFAELLWDGVPWPENEVKLDTCARTKDMACTSWTKHTLELRAPDAAESSVDRAGNPMVEQAVVQLYATGGEFDDDVRVASDARTTWTARSQDSGELVTLWFVVRDDRGGLSWLTRQLRVP